MLRCFQLGEKVKELAPKLFSSERTDWTKQQLEHLSQLNVLEKQLQDTQTKNDCESEHWERPNLNAITQ